MSADEPPRRLNAALAAGAARCERIKDDGEQCLKAAVQGSRWCEIHGAKAAKGIAASNFRHGRYSKYLPQRMVDDYEAAMRDDNLLSHAREVALGEAMLADYVRRMESGESDALWKQAQASMRELIHARDSKLPDSGQIMAACLLELERIILRGNRDVVVRTELLNWSDATRKAKEAEVKRMEKADLLMDKREVAAVVGTILRELKDAVEVHVPDESARQRIYSAISGAVARFYRDAHFRNPAAPGNREPDVQDDVPE